MPLRQFRRYVQNYVLIAGMLALVWLFSARFAGDISARILGAHEHAETLLVLSSIVIVFSLGFIVYELAKPTIIPSFVLAVLFGVVAGDLLSPVIESDVALYTLTTIGAVLILFGGGLDVPFRKFRDLLGPILSLSFLGTILTAFLLSLSLAYLSGVFGIAMPLPAIILLGAAVASTDPAAIIPSFQCLSFLRPRVKHIAVSESAINDVVGTVLTAVFLSILTQESGVLSVMDAYGALLDIHPLTLLFTSLSIGAGVGLMGYIILLLWGMRKERVHTEDGSDAALFLGVPILVYTVATVLGGSGFLATFLSSLLFRMRSHFRHVEHYFNHTIEGFMKPMIFMLLGAMTDPALLLAYADIGVSAGLLFMFVLRPLVVTISLLPFMRGTNAITWREVTFLSFVRETGVIPAVLLITISLSGIAGGEAVMAIGMWIILMTLIIEPPLTPMLAKFLGIASNRSAMPARKHSGPVAVLCSRGNSFVQRMETVVDWSQQHDVDNIILLHSPEEKYSEEFIKDVRARAQRLFKEINKDLVNDGKREINFEFLGGTGLLQDNIESLIAAGDVSIVFVGTKMLDYRLEDVKRLNVPFFFMN